ncbi:hypothetical protein [Pseudonocardia endophytica]|uniref:DUF5709 domain-containing protein n=1 Tax=Pseudonocardia endophytica TaxID=401976 RepID=A0A4R1HGG2_PSEEN|nr:hypothetical protein [Pseudonocardia endophytica]TCK20798.1 hypothetical protein EV378_4762 [Pseudonocardia endophytica]
MSQPDNAPRTTTTSIDDGSDDDVTGTDAGTVREDVDHEGNLRQGGAQSDAGLTAAAARELDRETEDEPTRSE